MTQREMADNPTVDHHSPKIVKGVLIVGICVLVLFVVVKGRTLYGEWQSLGEEQSRSQKNNVIGYVAINPMPSYAAKPEEWFRVEGNQAFLWAGWRDGKHQWFTVGREDVSINRISLPAGRDVIRAIDFPLVEFLGGELWGKIPDDAPVVGIEMEGVHAVYPLLVLEKVHIINDFIDRSPVLITFRPFVAENECVAVYRPIHEGRRLTLGHSGYEFVGSDPPRPLLYDRGTLSLWVARDDSMMAIAGPLKGVSLARIICPSPVAWSAVRSQHPNSRLVVGADRSQAMPPL
jgi:hypothetical protein